MVRLGKFINNGEVDYGLRLYKYKNGEYVENLITTNNGELWLKDTLVVGTAEEITWETNEGEKITGNCVAGISGIK